MNVRDLLSCESDAVPVCPPSPAISVSSDTSSVSSLDAPKRGWVAPFLLHLHQLLRRENPKIIRWAENGMAFQILDKEALTSQILPKYFKNKNFSSFQRQLNYFGFRKWSKARAQFPTYSREHFTRDNYSEMSLVKRQSKKSRKRKASTTEEEPAKRPATAPATIAVNEKCKPILPRLDAVRVASPLMHPVPVSMPVLSPARKLNSGFKLPSLRELSLASSQPFTAIGPIRTRLMA